MARTYAVVAGGGTAGHVLPALAVAEALVDAGHDPESILYMGARRGIETRLLPETQFPYVFNEVTGFQRSLSRQNLGFVPRMLRATRDTIRRFRSDRPAVVVSVGGYASMPAVFAARRLDIPIVVVSYDRTPGRASKLAARWATSCAVAFDNSILPRAEVAGAPLRRAILEVDRSRDRAAARSALGVPDDRFLVAVMGGSLGSGVLNEAIAAFVDAHRDDDGLAVRQVAGERFVDDVERPDGRDAMLHQVIGFESDMPAVYAAADLFVGRGGASTVHEVAATGTPAILVPWAASAEDHQTDNVRWLSEVDGAILLDEAVIGDDEQGLAAWIERLRADDTRRRALASNAAARGEVHRSGALARLIDRAAVTSETS